MASKGAKKVSLYILSRQPLTSEAEREEYWKFIADSSASDRSVAIRASAFVEHQLLDLLLHAMRMMDNEEIETLFFKQNATLADFSSRTDVARAFDLITADQRHDLDIIRHVRNTFAHAIINVTFDHELVAFECNKLKSDFFGITVPRLKYIHATHELVIQLLDKITLITRMKTKATLESIPDGLKTHQEYVSVLAAFLREA